MSVVVFNVICCEVEVVEVCFGCDVDVFFVSIVEDGDCFYGGEVDDVEVQFGCQFGQGDDFFDGICFKGWGVRF